MSDTTTAIYEIDEHKVKGTLIQGWTVGNYVALGLSVSLVVLFAVWLHITGHGFLWTVVLIAFLLPFNWISEYDKIYAEILRGINGVVIGRVLHGMLWYGPDERKDLVEGRIARFVRARFYDRHPPFQVTLQSVVALGETYGVLNQTDSNIGHMYLRADGSLYAGLDPEARQMAHKALSLALNRFFGRMDGDVGISQVRVTRPADLTILPLTQRVAGNPFMMKPDSFKLPPERERFFDWQRRNFELLAPAAMDNGAAENWELFVVTFKWGQESSRADKGKMSEEELYDRPLIDLGRALLEEVSNLERLGLQNPRIMGPAELAFFIRSCLAPFELDKYYQSRREGVIPLTDDEVFYVSQEMIDDHPELWGQDDLNSITNLDVWPVREIEVLHDRIRLDDSWFMVIREIQKARLEATDTAQAVHYTMPFNSWDSFAEVCEKVSGEVETRQIMFQESARQSLYRMMNRDRVVEHPKHRRRRLKYEEAINRASANSINQRYHRIRVLSAPTSDKLDTQLKLLRSRVAPQGVRIRPVKGRARLIDGVITGLLGANRL